jgi:hypothetical protein
MFQIGTRINEIVHLVLVIPSDFHGQVLALARYFPSNQIATVLQFVETRDECLWNTCCLLIRSIVHILIIKSAQSGQRELFLIRMNFGLVHIVVQTAVILNVLIDVKTAVYVVVVVVRLCRKVRTGRVACRRRGGRTFGIRNRVLVDILMRLVVLMLIELLNRVVQIVARTCRY